MGRDWKDETEKGGHAKMEHGTVFNLLLRLRDLHGRVANRPAHFCHFRARHFHTAKKLQVEPTFNRVNKTHTSRAHFSYISSVPTDKNTLKVS